MSDLKTEILLIADRFRVERVTRPLPSGELFSRAVVRHPGAVVIVPVMNDGRICFIKNYRVAVDREMLELPAGTLDHDEPIIETARRELLEETGFRCGSIVPLCDFFMSPGILDEHMYAFVATDLTAGESALELGEQIVNCPMTINELKESLRANRIQDGKSLAAILFYLNYAM